MQTPSRSPLRYPGGKSRLADRIIGLLAGQRPLSHYVEPFVGGGAVALGMAVRYPGMTLHLNDADNRVTALWIVLSQQDSAPYEKLVRRVESTVPDVDLWLDEKLARFGGSVDDLAFRALFLNRCTFSGNMSLTSGGPIGGFDQSGKWKIDARWKLHLLLPALEKTRALLSDRRVVVTTGPWQDVITQPGWHYYDPPYVTPSAKSLYASAFTTDDHLVLRDHLRDLWYPWVLSYDQDPGGHIDWLYGFAQREVVRHSTRVQKAGPQSRAEALYWPPERRRLAKR